MKLVAGRHGSSIEQRSEHGLDLCIRHIRVDAGWRAHKLFLENNIYIEMAMVARFVVAAWFCEGMAGIDVSIKIY